MPMHRMVLVAAATTVAGAGLASALWSGAPSLRAEAIDAPAGGSRGEPRVGESFVNWETPHVHPIEMTPDGSTLLVVNLPDNRLEVFDLTSGKPVSRGAVPVGLDPVAVRARTNTEAWVVNHISDSVSVVDLATMNVVRTLKVQDEPGDVVFAGTPQRAFVSCGNTNTVMVFDIANLGAAAQTVAIEGEDPRALAVSPDGESVYAAIFESGNRTTVLGGAADGKSGTRLEFPPNVVNDEDGPWGGENPPPNSGTGFNPPLSVGAEPPIRTSLIVRKEDDGRWLDDNGGDWTDKVSGANAADSGRVPGWDLVDHDLAVINANSLSVSYATGLMNMCMGIGVNPVSGKVTVVGTEATNHIRFEPIIAGKFIRVNIALVDPANLGSRTVVDLNPHLTYETGTIATAQRNRSIGDPRAIVWNSAGTKGYVAGMGSMNLVVINSDGARAGLTDTIWVGKGPTGLALDEARGQLYVLNKFDASISIVDLATEAQVDVVPFFDPSPYAIKVGRIHLYDTHKTSGLGQIACASCHVDSKMDRLAWDLGNPAADRAPLDGNNLGQGLIGLEPNTTQVPFEPFHPMKGPMTTQTLQDIIGKEPLHWRGDRAGLEDFAEAFITLQGGVWTLSDTQMQQFEDFLATIHFPPNPYRNFDNTLPTSMPLPGRLRTGRFGNAGQPLPNGNAQAGLALYRSTTRRVDMGAFACVTCHTLPTGMSTNYTRVGSTYQPLPPGPNGELHHALVSVDGTTNVAIKTPQLRNVYKKTGFNMLVQRNTAGFGVLHDGSIDTLERFISEPVFTVTSDQEVANLTAFVLCISGSDLPQGTVNNAFEPPGTSSKDAHASVGVQTTLRDANQPDAGQFTLITNMIALANQNKTGLVVKGRVGGVPRGFTYVGSDTFQSDRSAETFTSAALRSLAAPGSELTYTVVPKGSERRIGIDRDDDGVYDGDEPPDCPGDFDADGFITGLDFDLYVDAFEAGESGADHNGDGFVNGVDFDLFVADYERGC